ADVFLVELRKRVKDKRKREIEGILEAWIDRLSPARAYESAAVLFKDREYPLAERAVKSGLGKCLLSPAQKYKEKLEDLMALIFRLREKLDDAESLLRGQDFEGAASRFREAAYLNPEDADIGIKYNSALRLAEAERLYQQGNDEEALSLCRESGASGNYLKAMTDKINSLLRGCELRLNRKPSEALCVLAQIVKAYPADERAKRLYNGVSETVKKINESMAGLRQAFKDNAYSQLVPTGRFILEQENNREALNILLGSALKAYKERFYDEALKLSGLILEFQPAHPQAARIRENSYAQKLILKLDVSRQMLEAVIQAQAHWDKRILKNSGKGLAGSKDRKIVWRRFSRLRLLANNSGFRLSGFSYLNGSGAKGIADIRQFVKEGESYRLSPDKCLQAKDEQRVLGSPFKVTQVAGDYLQFEFSTKEEKEILPALLEQWQGGIIIRVEDITLIRQRNLLDSLLYCIRQSLKEERQPSSGN
ncbi:MAG: hypothetical protein AAB112_06390, partial [Thermodesulfobacteriota bacterium]